MCFLVDLFFFLEARRLCSDICRLQTQETLPDVLFEENPVMRLERELVNVNHVGEEQLAYSILVMEVSIAQAVSVIPFSIFSIFNIHFNNYISLSTHIFYELGLHVI